MALHHQHEGAISGHCDAVCKPQPVHQARCLLCFRVPLEQHTILATLHGIREAAHTAAPSQDWLASGLQHLKNEQCSSLADSYTPRAIIVCLTGRRLDWLDGLERHITSKTARGAQHSAHQQVAELCAAHRGVVPVTSKQWRHVCGRSEVDFAGGRRHTDGVDDCEGAAWMQAGSVRHSIAHKREVFAGPPMHQALQARDSITHARVVVGSACTRIHLASYSGRMQSVSLLDVPVPSLTDCKKRSKRCAVAPQPEPRATKLARDLLAVEHIGWSASLQHGEARSSMATTQARACTHMRTCTALHRYTPPEPSQLKPSTRPGPAYTSSFTEPATTSAPSMRIEYTVPFFAAVHSSQLEPSADLLPGRSSTCSGPLMTPDRMRLVLLAVMGCVIANLSANALGAAMSLDDRGSTEKGA